jgi:hypothetical protein
VVELFIVTYAYKVPKNRVDRYLDIQRRTRKVYFRYGCTGYEVFKGDNNCWLEINKFKDREHYENIKKSVDVDPEIEILWKEFCSIVEKEKVVTKKYEQIL